MVRPSSSSLISNHGLPALIAVSRSTIRLSSPAANCSRCSRMASSGVPGRVCSSLHSVDLDIALIADDQLLLGVEHAQPKRHVVDGRAKPLILYLDFALGPIDQPGTC